MHWLTLARWLAIWMLVSLSIDSVRGVPPTHAKLNANEHCLLRQHLPELRDRLARCRPFVPPEPTPGTKLAFALARWSFETSVFGSGLRLWRQPGQGSPLQPVGGRHRDGPDNSCELYFTPAGEVRGCCPAPCRPYLVPALR